MNPAPRGAASAAVDPHAPKLSPDDRRLGLARPHGRTLRAAPIALLLAAVLGALVLAAALAFRTPQAPIRTAAEPSGTPLAPIVPDAIRRAGERPTARAPLEAGPPRRAPGTATAEDPDRRLEREVDRRAHAAGILFEPPAGAADRAPPEAPARPAPPIEAPAPPVPTASVDPNLQDRKNAFLSGRPARATDSLAASLQHPPSPYAILAGTILPAVLLTAIDSDLPGPVVAQVREHVYDTVTGNTLLVPQGSRLVATYDSMVAWGQERVLLCWNRLLLPDGDSIDLGCMPAADLQGAAGLADGVDEHWWRLLKGASIATMLAATGTYVAGDTTAYNPTVTQVMARSASGEVNQVGQQLTRTSLSIQPTLTVRPGFSVNAIVTRDMTMAPYPDPPSALGLRP